MRKMLEEYQQMIDDIKAGKKIKSAEQKKEKSIQNPAKVSV